MKIKPVFHVGRELECQILGFNSLYCIMMVWSPFVVRLQIIVHIFVFVLTGLVVELWNCVRTTRVTEACAAGITEGWCSGKDINDRVRWRQAVATPAGSRGKRFVLLRTSFVS